VNQSSKIEAAEATSVPVDLAHLARYTLGDRALEAEILSLFLAQAPQSVIRLAGAQEHKHWREAAHSLKGSARGIGAWTLGDLAERAEKSVAWNVPTARRQILAGLEAALAEVGAFASRLGPAS
jgi:HPt (histidine-containing phosphotransfer) domain-containing protein